MEMDSLVETRVGLSVLHGRHFHIDAFQTTTPKDRQYGGAIHHRVLHHRYYLVRGLELHQAAVTVRTSALEVSHEVRSIKLVISIFTPSFVHPNYLS